MGEKECERESEKERERSATDRTCYQPSRRLPSLSLLSFNERDILHLFSRFAVRFPPSFDESLGERERERGKREGEKERKQFLWHIAFSLSRFGSVTRDFAMIHCFVPVTLSLQYRRNYYIRINSTTTSTSIPMSRRRCSCARSIYSKYPGFFVKHTHAETTNDADDSEREGKHPADP